MKPSVHDDGRRAEFTRSKAGQIDAASFFHEYHGHPIEDLEVLLPAVRPALSRLVAPLTSLLLLLLAPEEATRFPWYFRKQSLSVISDVLTSAESL